jgi:hypothetical protein
LEVVLGIVRAGRSFRMILHGDHRQCFVAHAFDATVIKIYVRYLDIGGCG